MSGGPSGSVRRSRRCRLLWRRAGIGSLAVAALAGCAATSAPTRPQPDPPASTTTVVRNYPTYRAGQTGVIRSRSQRAALRLSVGLPTTSTTALSSGYGDPPRNGYYVTFPITIVNTGRVPIAVRRLDFWVATPGVPRTTTDRGNAPFSGSTRQLDSTELGPRQRLANNLTFDVAQPRGTLFYGSAGRPQLAWTFG